MGSFEKPIIHEGQITDEERAAVYELLAGQVINLYPDRIFSYKGNFDCVVKIGSKAKHNLEISTFFEYNKADDSHIVRQLTVVVNEVEPIEMDFEGSVIKSNYLVCSSSELICCTTDYYIYDPISDVYMLVYSSENPQATSFNNLKISKKLRGLDKELNEELDGFTETKVNTMLKIFHNILEQEGYNNQGSENYDDEDEGFYD